MGIGYGVLLKRGNGATPETFTSIASITRMVGTLTQSQTFVDNTDYASPNGYEEFLPGIKTGGSFEAELKHIGGDASLSGIQNDFDNNLLRNYQIYFPADSEGTAKTATFAAYVESLAYDQPIKELKTMKATFKLTGPITWS